MQHQEKPFLSKKNPLNLKQKESECFSLMYVLPNYWLTWLLMLFSFLLTFVPQVIRNILGDVVGKIIMFTNSKRRNIVIINLSLCFKDKSKNEINNLCKSYFSYLGRAFIDLPLLWWRSNKTLQDSCQIINKHHIEEELSKGKGVILLAAHSVSLDFGGRSLSEFPIISMYKPFRNKLLNWFIGRSRSKETDNVVVYPRDNFPFRKVIKALKNGVVFYYLADEDLGIENSVFENFFDEKKSTLTSISKISSLSNASVLPCINHYCQESKKYITYIGEPLKNFPSNNLQKDANTINIALEKIILRDIEQYMWSLRLFQTRPAGKRYPYQ
ncbi:MAG: lysophospholipid acyltransferase family protein [Gammaproteobacteria bacterium]|nr:lysophospholipid acyltransferase family protein [Gammaproteobacteria bacterium]